MNRLAIYAVVLIVTFSLGFASGWQQKTPQVNSAIVKQVVKTTKIEAKNETQVEKQNDSDTIKIRQLEDDLAAARRAARDSGVPKPPQHSCVPSSQGDARPGEAASADGESARRYEEAYRRFRDELLTSGAVAEQLRLQVLSCQVQCPR